jgi:hypothetical protein
MINIIIENEINKIKFHMIVPNIKTEKYLYVSINDNEIHQYNNIKIMNLLK